MFYLFLGKYKWRMKKALVFFLCLYCFAACKPEKTLPFLDIERMQADNCDLLDDSPGYQIMNYGASFLDSTFRFQPDEIGKMMVYGGNLYLLAKGELRCYEFPSGKLTLRFRSPHPVISFALDTLDGSLYALDTEQAELLRFSSDGIKQGGMPLDKSYGYRDISCLGDGRLLLTTDGFPDPYLFRIPAFGQSPVRLLSPKKERERQLLPDSLACPLEVIGRGGNGLLYKYLLNDTLYMLKGDSCRPLFTCEMGNKKVRLGNKKQLLKENDRLCITGIWETKDYWWIQYRCNILVKEIRYRYTSMGILYKNLSIKESGYTFFIPDQTIVMNTRKPLYMNEEGTCFVQVYNPEDHLKDGKRELPFNLEQDRDSGNLILNYFYIKELKKKKI